jgi:predicted nuclease of predicted toxin-antitoxin system
MKGFIADENLNRSFVKKLQQAGFMIREICVEASGIQDSEVIELVRRENAILITEDKDFGEWVFAHEVTDLRVIFLRYDKSDLEQVAETLLYVAREFATKTGHFFITVTKNKIRISEW